VLSSRVRTSTRAQFCSPHNVGAAELLEELAEQHQLRLTAEPKSGRDSKLNKSTSVANVLKACSERSTPRSVSKASRPIPHSHPRARWQTSMRQARGAGMSPDVHRESTTRSASATQPKLPKLRASKKVEDARKCDHALVYLTSRTWTSGQASAAFANDVCAARRASLCALPLHVWHADARRSLRPCSSHVPSHTASS
jgi:hypothetical protein